jgi:hypothetical protein
MSITCTDSLPKNPQDGDQIADHLGNVYEYNAEANSWINIGILQTPDIVNEQQDGIITPEIYNQIREIEQLEQQGVDFNKSKLFIGRRPDNPYFYYFHSSDDLVKFSPEVTTEGLKKLRIEFDRARFIQKLARTPCIGPQGRKGIQGPAGQDGVPAEDERFLTSEEVTREYYKFNTKVSTPLEDEPVSLRVFDTGVLAFEILVSIEGTDVLQFNDTEDFVVDQERTKIEFNEDNDLIGTIYLSKGSFTPEPLRWKHKARQRGLKGDPGEDGSALLKVVNDPFGDDFVTFNEYFASLRVSQDEDIFVLKKKVSDKLCSSNIKMTIQTLPVPKLEDRHVMAVDMATKRCKDIGYYKFQPEEIELPDLTIPGWTPTIACNDRRRFEFNKFRWFDEVEEVASQSPDCITAGFAFQIFGDPNPTDQCCRDDFFLCGNLGDLCTIEGVPCAEPPGVLPFSSSSVSVSSSSSSTDGDGEISSSSSSSSFSSSSSSFESESSSSSSSSLLSSSSSSKSSSSSSSSESSSSSQSSSSSSSSSSETDVPESSSSCSSSSSKLCEEQIVTCCEENCKDCTEAGFDAEVKFVVGEAQLPDFARGASDDCCPATTEGGSPVYWEDKDTVQFTVGPCISNDRESCNKADKIVKYTLCNKTTKSLQVFTKFAVQLTGSPCLVEYGGFSGGSCSWPGSTVGDADAFGPLFCIGPCSVQTVYHAFRLIAPCESVEDCCSTNAQVSTFCFTTCVTDTKDCDSLCQQVLKDFFDIDSVDGCECCVPDWVDIETSEPCFIDIRSSDIGFTDELCCEDSLLLYSSDCLTCMEVDPEKCDDDFSPACDHDAPFDFVYECTNNMDPFDPENPGTCTFEIVTDEFDPAYRDPCECEEIATDVSQCSEIPGSGVVYRGVDNTDCPYKTGHAGFTPASECAAAGEAEPCADTPPTNKCT